MDVCGRGDSLESEPLPVTFSPGPLSYLLSASVSPSVNRNAKGLAEPFQHLWARPRPGTQ